jgi:hypothetical protein
VGNGMGMIVDRGYAHAGDYHTARLETAPLGHFFNVISNGYGAMPDYSAQITPVDRWAIAAYIRALQLSQKATHADVPAGTQVQPLSSIAESEGLPANFAQQWTLPPTAVNGTPDDQPYVLPNTQPNATSGSGAPVASRPAAVKSPATATAQKTAAKQ